MTHEEPCIDSLIHSCRPTPQHKRLNVLCFRAPILSPLISKYRHGHHMFFSPLAWSSGWVKTKLGAAVSKTSWVGFINCPLNAHIYASLSGVFFPQQNCLCVHTARQLCTRERGSATQEIQRRARWYASLNRGDWLFLTVNIWQRMNERLTGI